MNDNYLSHLYALLRCMRRCDMRYDHAMRVYLVFVIILQIRTKPGFWSNDTVYFGSKDHFLYAIHYTKTNKKPIIISDDDALNDDYADDDTDDDGGIPPGEDTEDRKSNKDNASLSAGSISGIAIGSFLFCVLVLCICYLLLKTPFLANYGCKKKQTRVIRK